MRENGQAISRPGIQTEAAIDRLTVFTFAQPPFTQFVIKRYVKTMQKQQMIFLYFCIRLFKLFFAALLYMTAKSAAICVIMRAFNSFGAKDARTPFSNRLRTSFRVRC